MYKGCKNLKTKKQLRQEKELKIKEEKEKFLIKKIEKEKRNNEIYKDFNKKNIDVLSF